MHLVRGLIIQPNKRLLFAFFTGRWNPKVCGLRRVARQRAGKDGASETTISARQSHLSLNVDKKRPSVVLAVPDHRLRPGQGSSPVVMLQILDKIPN